MEVCVWLGVYPEPDRGTCEWEVGSQRSMGRSLAGILGQIAGKAFLCSICLPSSSIPLVKEASLEI